MKFIVFIGCFVLSLLFGVYNSWLFVDLWEWFIVPIFNVKSMNVVQGFGFLMVVGWCITPILSNLQDISKATDATPNDFFGLVGKIMSSSLACAMAFTISWAVAKFIVLSFM